MSKPYDIVLYGASGFTGKLCARYLQNCSSASTNKFAIAGRSENKLKAVAQDIGAPDTPILIADSHDEDALREMVRKTRVVITTAGPYTLYGSTLVKVCAENGVHCVDLTGEPTWTHDMQKLYGDAAKQSKAIFIHGAGFDSMPGDLSTYLAVKKLRSATKASCGLVTSGYSLKGGMSGGTFNTLLVISKQAKDAQKAAVLRDPYSLSPVRGSDKPKPSLTYKDGDRVGGYFVMESANAPVVRQTWGILEEAAKKDPNHFSYGPEFKYREFQMTPNRFWAGLMSVSIFSFFLLLAKFPFFHRMAQKYGLQSGDGPTESQMTNGSFKVISVARDVENKVFAKTVMKARGDPGYLGTSIMICEAALGLAHDYDRLTDTAKEGGHLTAATIFGDGVLKERLEKTGRFEWDTQLVDHP